MRNFNSTLVFWENNLESLFETLSKDRQTFLFTDENVLKLYGNFHLPYYAMPAGEKYKTKETLFALLERMAGEGLLRSAQLICLGGGVVTDVGGLAASLYMRGVSHTFVPTTLLSQADACMGGKTGIDFWGIKNLLGTFYPPEQISFSQTFLQTLPKREILSGLGEIVKCGALNGDLFELLRESRDDLENLDFLWRAVKACVALKMKIVQEDPYEQGERKCLNLGHTTAHVLEMSKMGMSHGECVLYGLLLELPFAAEYGASASFCEQLRALCLSALGKTIKLSLTQRELHLALSDKKNTEREKIGLVIATDVGKWRKIQLPFESYLKGIQREIEKYC